MYEINNLRVIPCNATHILPDLSLRYEINNLSGTPCIANTFYKISR